MRITKVFMVLMEVEVEEWQTSCPLFTMYSAKTHEPNKKFFFWQKHYDLVYPEFVEGNLYSISFQI